MTQLLNIDWYRGLIQGKQMVMIGYSDSAKDAGVMAASWAQYQAQDALIKTCEKAGIELTLFHGRGGSIGRGGAPAHAALLSQPPGSLKGGLRVTEQGEMIRFKYGLPEITVSSLSLYTGRFWKPTCCHRLSRKRAGVVLWMNCLLSPAMSTAATYVKTKILCLTSAPLRRNKNWVNCRWVHVRRNVAQPAASSHCALFRGFSPGRKNRLMLPAWLGAGTALQKVVEDGKTERAGSHVPRLAILLDASRHAGDGLRQSRPVAGGIL